MHLILNWLWQGTVVAVATAAILRVLASSRAQPRYLALWVGLISVSLLPAVPFIWAWTAPASVEVASRADATLSIPARWWTSSLAALALWTLWSGVYTGRLLGALLALQRATKRCRDIPRAHERRLTHWMQVRDDARRTRLAVSDQVRYAAVLGCGSPVIAIAPALLDQLSDEELDRVVIHEWAHVQRRDDFAHGVQLCLRAIAGWHPAVWWLERQLDLEREAACDERAVAVTGSAKAYAACLAKLASLPVTPLRSLPAVAALSSSGLRRRIVRVLAAPAQMQRRGWWSAGMAAALVVSGIALAAGRFSLVISMPAPADFVRSAGLVVPITSLATPHMPISIERSHTPLRAPASSARPTQQRLHSGTTLPNLDSPPVEKSRSSPTILSQEPAAQILSSSGRLPDPALLLLPPASIVPTNSPVSAAWAEPGSEAVRGWRAAADGGVAIGRASEKAAVATADFFTRLGKKVAAAF
ncbi:MAG: M56 family metallopeptidase [Acidobacteria bacterium]|nr:M56 family metallopeptidase [Acidobacteriota bacterium]